MSKRILVVDDDEAVRTSLRKVLYDAGYEVALAAGGLEALTRLDLESVDLLLLDLNLPNQSGWDVVEPLSQSHPGIPFIIITGLPHQHASARAAGAAALLEKPIEVPALLRTLETLLAKPGVESAREAGSLGSPNTKPQIDAGLPMPAKGRRPGAQEEERLLS